MKQVPTALVTEQNVENLSQGDKSLMKQKTNPSSTKFIIQASAPREDAKVLLGDAE